MGLFSFMKSQFIELIEWTNTPSQTIVQLIPFGNKLIKMGATLTVRESQVAVVVNEGKIADVFESGRYTLSQQNLPLLSAQRLWKVGFKSPFKAEVYYVSTKHFTDMEWETVNPLIIKTSDLGVIRCKASGIFTFRVMNANQFMKKIFGTNQIYDTSYMIGKLKSKLIAGLIDLLKETEMSALDLTFHYDEISENTENKLQERFAEQGLELCSFIIESIILPDHIVTAAQTAAAKVTEAELTKIEIEAIALENACLECSHPIVNGMKFCTDCGAEFKREYACNCGYMLNSSMKYCPDCGGKV